MARRAEMLKDLQQEIRLLKEGRTQEIRAQPEGRSVVGRGGNPQYLTLADVNALLEQDRENSQGSLSNFLRIPHSHRNSLARHILKDMNP